jgi:hypothetical protein
MLAGSVGSDARKWWVLFALAGLATYLHQLSGLPVALALWLALALTKPPQLSYRQFALVALSAGVVYLLTIVPYAWIYVNTALAAKAGTVGAEVLEISRLTGGQYFELSSGVDKGLLTTWGGWRGLMLVFALIGCAVVYRNAPYERTRLRFVLALLVGLFTATVVIPLAEHVITISLGGNVLQPDLVRGMRYLIPIVLLLAFWGASRLKLRGRSLGAFGAAAVFAFWFGATDSGARYGQPDPALSLWTCWSRLPLFCPVGADANDRLALLEYARRETPVGTTFFSDRLSLPLRYHSLRPATFDFKNYAALSYSNHRLFVAMLPELKRYLAIHAMPDDRMRSRAWAAFARDLGSDFVIVSERIPPDAAASLGRVVLHNSQGAIIDLR